MDESSNEVTNSNEIIKQEEPPIDPDSSEEQLKPIENEEDDDKVTSKRRRSLIKVVQPTDEIPEINSIVPSDSSQEQEPLPDEKDENITNNDVESDEKSLDERGRPVKIVDPFSAPQSAEEHLAQSKPVENEQNDDETTPIKRRISIKVVQSVEEPVSNIESKPVENEQNVEIKEETSSNDYNEIPMEISEERSKSAGGESTDDETPIAVTNRRRKSVKVVQAKEDTNEKSDTNSSEGKPITRHKRTKKPKDETSSESRRRSKRSISPKNYNAANDSKVLLYIFSNL